MSTLKAFVRGRRLDLEVPADWPDGMEVEIHPIRDEAPSDDHRPMSPEEIARLLTAMEKIEPFEMTPQEEAEIEAGRKRSKDYTVATMHKDIEELFP